MLSIILIIFIILMVMSRKLDLDLEIKGIESFNPINLDEEEKEEVEAVVEIKVVKEVVSVFVKEKEKDEEIEDLLSNIKRIKSGSNSKQRDPYAIKHVQKEIRSHSRRGDHGHKGYTRVQTLAYKKARAFKISHLNEWC